MWEQLFPQICRNRLLGVPIEAKNRPVTDVGWPWVGDSITWLLGGPGTHSGMSASCSEFELAAINTQFKTNQNIWNNSDSEVKIMGLS